MIKSKYSLGMRILFLLDSLPRLSLSTLAEIRKLVLLFSFILLMCFLKLDISFRMLCPKCRSSIRPAFLIIIRLRNTPSDFCVLRQKYLLFLKDPIYHLYTQKELKGMGPRGIEPRISTVSG